MPGESEWPFRPDHEKVDDKKGHPWTTIRAMPLWLLSHQTIDMRLLPSSPVRLGESDFIPYDLKGVELMKQSIALGDKFIPALHHNNSARLKCINHTPNRH